MLKTRHFQFRAMDSNGPNMKIAVRRLSLQNRRAMYTVPRTTTILAATGVIIAYGYLSRG